MTRPSLPTSSASRTPSFMVNVLDIQDRGGQVPAAGLWKKRSLSIGLNSGKIVQPTNVLSLRRGLDDVAASVPDPYRHSHRNHRRGCLCHGLPARTKKRSLPLTKQRVCWPRSGSSHLHLVVPAESVTKPAPYCNGVRSGDGVMVRRAEEGTTRYSSEDTSPAKSAG